jgi:hypothetical protein
MARTIPMDEVRFILEVEQDESPVRGNAMASGDDALDKQVEDEIIERLNDGDVWAWAQVTVTAQFGPLEGHDYLGGCCYKDEEDFKQPGGYWEDMKQRAIDDLQAQADELAELICE